MKKLIDFIKSKERENNLTAPEKKVSPKAKKAHSSIDQAKEDKEPNDLFWDDYSDIGYC